MEIKPSEFTFIVFPVSLNNGLAVEVHGILFILPFSHSCNTMGLAQLQRGLTFAAKRRACHSLFDVLCCVVRGVRFDARSSYFQSLSVFPEITTN